MLKRFAPLSVFIMVVAVGLLAMGCSGDSDRIVSSGTEGTGLNIDTDYDNGWTNYVYSDFDQDDPNDDANDDAENDDGLGGDLDLGDDDPDADVVNQQDSDVDSNPEN